MVEGEDEEEDTSPEEGEGYAGPKRNIKRAGKPEKPKPKYAVLREDADIEQAEKVVRDAAALRERLQLLFGTDEIPPVITGDHADYELFDRADEVLASVMRAVQNLSQACHNNGEVKTALANAKTAIGSLQEFSTQQPTDEQLQPAYTEILAFQASIPSLLRSESLAKIGEELAAKTASTARTEKHQIAVSRRAPPAEKKTSL